MIFRCTSTWDVPTFTSDDGNMRISQKKRCEERRWHTGWHHATWTHLPLGGEAEYRTFEWSGEPDHPFERETVSAGFWTPLRPPTLLQPTTLNQFGGMDSQTGTGDAVAATTSIPTPMVATTDGPTCPTCGSHGPANGCLDEWHYTLPQSTIRFEVDRTPLMKAHLALLRYGRHGYGCNSLLYPDCTCGLAEAIRISCPAPEDHH